jgi:hypothetical protein
MPDLRFGRIIQPANYRDPRPHFKSSPMIRLTITPAAFDAISATLPFGSVGFERAPDAKDEVAIWVEEVMVNRLTDLRRPGESYSDVILRLVAMEKGAF